MTEYKIVEGYEIINSFRIGTDTIVIGELKNAEKGRRYICSFVVDVGITFFDENKMLISDNYLDILKHFSDLLNKSIMRLEIAMRNSVIPYQVITADDCLANNYTKNITGQIVAIKREAFKPEYQNAKNQICIVTGGVGAEAYAKGETVKCINICTGREKEYRRVDILGELKAECTPFWVNNYQLILQPDERVFEHNNRHYIFYRELTKEEHEDLNDSVIMDISDKGYDYQLFSLVAKGEINGLFLCLENNNLYLPCKKFLTLWMGERDAE